MSKTSDTTRLRLDEDALEAAKRSLEKGAVLKSLYGPWWSADLVRTRGRPLS